MSGCAPVTPLVVLHADVAELHVPGRGVVGQEGQYLALERLDDRQGFDPEAGTVQPYNKAFMTPTANR